MACVLLIIILVFVVILIKRKVKGQKDDLDKLAFKMEELEKNIAEDIREGNTLIVFDLIYLLHGR